MKFLLDENVTDKLRTYLNDNGYNVESIKNMGKLAIDDNQVMKIAIEEQRVLITQNGKDFVIQVPPKGEKSHYGLFWMITRITRKNYEQIGQVIKSLLIEVKGSCKNDCPETYCLELVDEIYKIHQDNDLKIIYKKFANQSEKTSAKARYAIIPNFHIETAKKGALN